MEFVNSFNFSASDRVTIRDVDRVIKYGLPMCIATRVNLKKVKHSLQQIAGRNPSNSGKFTCFWLEYHKKIEEIVGKKRAKDMWNGRPYDRLAAA